MTEHTPIDAWKLEGYALGELSDEEMRVMQRRIEDDPAAQAQLEELHRSNDEIHRQYPAMEMVAEIERRRHRVDVAERVGAQRSRRVQLIGMLGVFAGVAAVAFIGLRPAAPPATDAIPEEVILLKGDNQLTIHRIGMGGPELLAEGAQVKTGETLQVGYRAAGAKYGVIVSADGRGAVTVHLPKGSKAAALEQGGRVSLGHSYVLDDAPAFERFWFVTAADPFATAAVEAAVAAWTQNREGGLKLAPQFAQTSLELRKAD